MKINVKKVCLYGGIALLVILLILGSLCDLQISKAIADLKEGQYQSSNIFGRIFETIGEMPLYLTVGFACSVIYANLNKRKQKKYFIVVKIICVLLTLFVFYFMYYRLFKYLSIHFDFEDRLGKVTDYLAYFLLGALSCGILFFFSKKYPVYFLNKMLPLAFVMLSASLFSVIFSQGIKIISKRYRFCTLNAIQDFGLFSDWFNFNGKLPITDQMLLMGVQSDGAKSFPSGHVASGALVICLTALPALFDELKNKKYRIIINAVIWLYIVLLMVSRMVMGKHYLSDVLFGLLITIVCYVLSEKIIGKILKKHQIKPITILNPVIVEERI